MHNPTSPHPKCAIPLHICAWVQVYCVYLVCWMQISTNHHLGYLLHRQNEAEALEVSFTIEKCVTFGREHYWLWHIYCSIWDDLIIIATVVNTSKACYRCNVFTCYQYMACLQSSLGSFSPYCYCSSSFTLMTKKKLSVQDSISYNFSWQAIDCQTTSLIAVHLTRL